MYSCIVSERYGGIDSYRYRYALTFKSPKQRDLFIHYINCIQMSKTDIEKFENARLFKNLYFSAFPATIKEIKQRKYSFFRIKKSQWYELVQESFLDYFHDFARIQRRTDRVFFGVEYVWIDDFTYSNRYMLESTRILSHLPSVDEGLYLSSYMYVMDALTDYLNEGVYF